MHVQRIAAGSTWIKGRAYLPTDAVTSVVSGPRPASGTPRGRDTVSAAEFGQWPSPAHSTEVISDDTHCSSNPATPGCNDGISPLIGRRRPWAGIYVHVYTPPVPVAQMLPFGRVFVRGGWLLEYIESGVARLLVIATLLLSPNSRVRQGSECFLWATFMSRGCPRLPP